MIDIVPEKRVVKISATIDDDINLILDAIIKVEAAFILLIVPHGNDLINSPIGLKALRKKTYEKSKRMILVVPAGSAYELAKKAGFIATSSQEAVTSDLWQTTMDQYDQQYHEQVGMNSQKKLPQNLGTKTEYIDQDEGRLPAPEIISGGININDAKIDDFTDKLENAVATRVPDPKQRVTGMDFSKMMRNGNYSSGISVPKKQSLPTISATLAPPQEINTFNPDIVPKKVGIAMAKVGKKKEITPAVKVMLFLISAGVIAFIGIFVMYYLYFTGIRVELFVQSYPETVSDKVTATSAVTGFDVNKKEIQLTKETVQKNATVSFKATKTGSEGKKATGTVDFKNTDVATKTIPAGTLLVASGKNFATVVVAVIPGKGAGTFATLQDVAVTAVDIGEDYNIASSTFSVTGFPTVSAENNTAFTGGTKRTFTVVGQEDVDKAVKTLQEELEKQAVSDLAAYTDNDNGYAFIRPSVKTTIKDGKPTVNPAVGAEVKTTDEDPTIALWITTTGLYYHEDSLFLLAEKLLIEAYKVEKTLSAADIVLTTVQDTKLTVDKVDVDKNELVTVEFTAKGLMTSKIDTEKVKTDIAAKKWPEMLEIINKMPTLSNQKQPIVKFFPSWMPEYVRYVPKDVSRIEISVKSAETAETVVQ
jgi:hypothetical protein